MDLLASLVALINAVTNALGGVFFAPISVMPGWLSITIISAVTGVLLLVIWKYTSNQKAIGRVRDKINANLLAVWLFRDSLAVTLRSQGRVLLASFKLMYYAIVPLLIMMGPVILLLAQMGLWYQFRPLEPRADQAVVKLELGKGGEDLPQVTLEHGDAVEVLVGPVRVPSKREIYWKIRPLRQGEHRLGFRVGDKRYEKQLAAGKGLMRVNPKRPGTDFFEVLLYPLEKPFGAGAAVRSISIDYPPRDSKIYGADWWILYFFIVSMIFAFAFIPILKVRI